MRRLYHPESIRDWEVNLLQQGGSLPVYTGIPYQRGAGIGSFLRGLFRTIWPTVKKVGLAAGKEALQAGSEATRDYLNEGTDFKTALKRRGKQALGRTVSRFGQQLQHGHGVGSRSVRKSIKGLKCSQRLNTRRKPKSRRKTDIFGHG